MGWRTHFLHMAANYRLKFRKFDRLNFNAVNLISYNLGQKHFYQSAKKTLIRTTGLIILLPMPIQRLSNMWAPRYSYEHSCILSTLNTDVEPKNRNSSIIQRVPNVYTLHGQSFC